MKIGILHIVFLIVLGSTARAQYYNLNFKSYKAKDGLTSDDIQCLHTDSEGSLWIGTKFGLSEFDGQTFRNFYFDPKNQSSLGGANVLDIAEDKVGNLWVAIENFGLTKVNRKTHQFENFKIPFFHIVEERFINTVHVDKEDKIWVGTETSIYLFDPVKHKYVRTFVKDRKDNLDIISILSDDQGNLWAATYEGEILYKKKGDVHFSIVENIPTIGLINQLYYVGGNQILIASEHGIFEIQIKASLEKSRVQRASFFKQVVNISRLAKDVDGNIWMANKDKGLEIYFPASNYLQQLNVSRYFPLDPELILWKAFKIDNEGGFWIGGEQGLFQFNNKNSQFSVYNTVTKLNSKFSFGNTIGIDGDENNIITVCTKGISIYGKKENDFVLLETAKEFKSKNIIYNNILGVSKDVWWLSTNIGILELKRGSASYTLTYAKQFLKHPELSKCEVFNICSNNDGQFWIATPNHGLFSYNLNTKKFNLYEDVGSQKNKKELGHTDYVAVSAEGDVVVGNHNGLAIKKKNSEIFIPVEHLIDSLIDWTALSVYDICESNGFWWLATEGHGLWKLDLNQKKVVVYTQEDGLPSNSIISLLPNNQGKLVAGTSRGLSIFDIKTSQCKNFFNQDGLISEQFIRKAKFKNSDGECFLSTSGGVISFYPEKIKHTIRKPSIKLNSILVDNHPFSDSLLFAFEESKKIKIKYSQRLAMVFSPHILSGPPNYVLRFKLNDEEDWHVSSSSKNLYFINVDPGVYEVTAQFIETRGAGMSQFFKFRLKIVPPFWKTKIFFVSMMILMFISVWFLVGSVYKRRLKKEKILASIKSHIDNERMRIAMELHDDIGGNLTALTLIGSLLKDKEMNESAHNLVDKIIEASDQMVDDMNEIVWALNTSNDSLKSMMGYIKQNISELLSNAEIKLILTEPIDYADRFVSGRIRRNIFLIVKEICNNIVKHAFTKKVEITIYTNSKLEIIISDYGVGVHNDDLENGRGMGQSNLTKRSSEIGATIQFKNEKGYTIYFSIPLNNMMMES